MARDVCTLGIAEMLEMLESGRATSVDLVTACLNRIGYLDRTGPCINAVPLVNPDVFWEARESDNRRASGAPIGRLEGIPFTVKDSFKVRGMTVAAGSPAFADLIANEDAASVALLRAEGAVLIGKTNMPPMAAGGVQPGLYGYARSPYHPSYLSAAYGSGSSNGAGAATAAGFAAFGLAEETLSSGRSPASNNGLVAYTPSRGGIPITGNWALFPTCDVVVPYARSVQDLLLLLDVLVAEWRETTGDFWRQQAVVELPRLEPAGNSGFNHERPADLRGLRIGVPRMFLGEDAEKVNPVAVRSSVRALWERAAEQLVGLGAEVVHVDFPVVSNYECDRRSARGLVERGLVADGWFEAETGVMIARAWDDFLRENAMPGRDSLSEIDGDRIFPNQPAEVYANARTAFDFTRLVELAKGRLPRWDEIPGYEQSVRGLEQARREDLESWMAQLGLDAIAFPANGDVARADIFDRPEAMEAALRNGVLFSNGNRAIRHLGIPTVTVPMGHMADIGMPVGLTIAGPAYSDDFLLDIAAAYERATKPSVCPPLAPSLPSSTMPERQPRIPASAPGEKPSVSTRFHPQGGESQVDVVIHDTTSQLSLVDVWVDGQVQYVARENDRWVCAARISQSRPRLGDSAMVVVRWTDQDSATDGVFVECSLTPGK